MSARVELRVTMELLSVTSTRGLWVRSTSFTKESVASIFWEPAVREYPAIP